METGLLGGIPVEVRRSDRGTYYMRINRGEDQDGLVGWKATGDGRLMSMWLRNGEWWLAPPEAKVRQYQCWSKLGTVMGMKTVTLEWHEGLFVRECSGEGGT